MITEVGQVAKVQPDLVWVRTIQSSACGACQAKSGCGQHVLSRFVDSSRLIPLLPNKELTLREGQSVEIGIGENVVVVTSLIAYVLPIVLLVVGAAAGAGLGASDFWSVSGALFGLACGAFIGRFTLRFLNPAWFNPVLIKVVQENQPTIATATIATG